MATTTAPTTGADFFGSARVQRRQLHPLVAWGVILVVFVVAYGIPALGSLMTLLGTDVETPHPAASEKDLLAWSVSILFLQAIGLLIAVFAVLVVLTRQQSTPSAPLPLGSIAARPQLLTATLVPVVIGIIALSFAIGHSLADTGIIGPYHPRPSMSQRTLRLAIWDTIYGSVTGPFEEISVLLAPVVLLRASGHRWTTVYIVCIAMRLSFHVDYGLAITAGLAIWATLMITIYRATQQITALLIAHGLYNALGNLADLLHAHHDDQAIAALGTTAIAIQWALAAVGITIMIVFTTRHLTLTRHTA